ALRRLLHIRERRHDAELDPGRLAAAEVQRRARSLPGDLVRAADERIVCCGRQWPGPLPAEPRRPSERRAASRPVAALSGRAGGAEGENLESDRAAYLLDFALGLGSGSADLVFSATAVSFTLSIAFGASEGVSRISMRRLRARPAAVLLLAMG